MSSIYSYEQKMTLKPKELLLRVPSDDICVFCGSSDELWDLHPQGKYPQNSRPEDYSLMLLSCFNIKVNNHASKKKTCDYCTIVSTAWSQWDSCGLVDLSGSGGLCEICVLRLRDASLFRAQVEAAGTFLQHALEEPYTIPDSPEQQPTIEDSPRPGKEKIKIKFSDDDNLDTFWDDDSMNSHKEEDQKQHLKELKDCESLEWTNQKPLKNNLKSEDEGVKRIEWIDQQQYPKPSTFRLPKLKPDSHECPVCGEVFPNRRKLRQHFVYHFPQFLCHLCGKVFAKGITYRAHLERHLAKSFPCLRCWNKSYKTKSSLRQHQMTAHENKDLYSCPKCLIRFPSAHVRKAHLLKEHGVWTNQYICPECSRVCRTPSLLDKHLRKVHRKEKNVSCPECDALFFSRTELGKHAISHSDVRNYICDICSKAFKHRRHLQLHLAIHYNIRNHKCSLCNAAFVQNTSLKVHMRSHHKKALSKEDRQPSEVVSHRDDKE